MPTKRTKPSKKAKPKVKRPDIEVLTSSYGVIFVAHTLDAARELRSRGYVPKVELWK